MILEPRPPIVNLAAQALIDYQMPTGEWGSANVSAARRYARVNRADKVKPEYLSMFRKPNSYRSLTGLEALRHLGLENQASSRFRIALHWFGENLASGQFEEWDTIGPGLFPDRPELPAIDATSDTRHTAQAVAALLRFSPTRSVQLIEALSRLVEGQNKDGTWPRRPGSGGIEVLRNVCCLDVLLLAQTEEETERLRLAGLREAFQDRVDIAIGRSIAWLRETQSDHGGLIVDEYQTAMVLERVGRRLVGSSSTAQIVSRARSALFDRIEERGSWTNSSIRSKAIRETETNRYEVTVRVLAAIAQSGSIPADNPAIQRACEFLRESFDVGSIDSSDYRYYIYAFEQADQGREVGPTSLTDYLSGAAETDNAKEVVQAARNLASWTIQGLRRLAVLDEGRALGMPGYAAACHIGARELESFAQTWMTLPSPVSADVGRILRNAVHPLLMTDEHPDRLQLDDVADELTELTQMLFVSEEAPQEAGPGAQTLVREASDAVADLLAYVGEQIRSREPALERFGGQLLADRYRELVGTRNRLLSLQSELADAAASDGIGKIESLIVMIDEIGADIRGKQWKPIMEKLGD